MSLFLPNIPQPGDNLDFSQGQLLSNNQGLDTVFGIDHYKFSDATSNKGFHNKVTTPVFVAAPPTGLPPVTTTNPIFYGFQQTAPLGVLQYSRGPNNAAPSPVTMLQSQAAGISLVVGASTNILDFTGIIRAYGTLYFVDLDSFSLVNAISSVLIYWFGTGFIGASSVGSLGPVAVGNMLTLKNNSGTNKTNIFWTLQFYRIDT